MKSRIEWILLLVVIVSATGIGRRPLWAQPADQFIFYAGHGDVQKTVTMRYSRKLEPLGFTVNHPVSGYRQGTGVDSQGRYALCVAPSQVKDAVWMGSDGHVVSSTPLDHHPYSARVSRTGTAYFLSKVSGVIGPVYSVDGGGNVFWSNIDGPQIYALPPEHLTIRPNGELWIGGSAANFSGGWLWTPVIQRIDLQTGKAVRVTELPPTALPNGDTFLSGLVSSPDGTMWGFLTPIVVNPSFVQTDGIHVLNIFDAIGGGYNGNTGQLRIDANGDLLVTSYHSEEGALGSELRRISQHDGSVLDKYSLLSEDFYAAVGTFALGATGEEAFVSGASEVGYFMSRINLVTGVRSLIHLPLNLSSPQIPIGDPTGFIRANVVDQDGDADSDGATNREETLAGSHPYDASSRPDGPKIHVSFLATSNSLRLRCLDPDGLLHPTLGLDLTTLSVIAEGYGDILPWLLNFVTSVTMSPDGTDATVEFGGLPIPSHLEVGLEARVTDLTGAYGWDWQITPPGIRFVGN